MISRKLENGFRKPLSALVQRLKLRHLHLSFQKSTVHRNMEIFGIWMFSRISKPVLSEQNQREELEWAWDKVSRDRHEQVHFEDFKDTKNAGATWLYIYKDQLRHYLYRGEEEHTERFAWDAYKNSDISCCSRQTTRGILLETFFEAKIGCWALD